MREFESSTICSQHGAPHQECASQHARQAKEFRIDHEAESLLTRAGLAICARIESAFGHLETAVAPGSSRPLERWKTFLSVLSKVWPENDGQRIKPRFFLEWISPQLAGVSVKFEPLRDVSEADYAFVEGQDGGIITLGWKTVLEADSREAARSAMETVFEHVVHETAHIFYPGTSIDEQGGGIEGAVKYLCHPGEMRAYAKEYAFKYRRAFPGEPFDLEKMRSIISTNDERNYLIQFANPQKQEEYRAVANVAQTHTTVVRLIEAFVRHFDCETKRE